MTVATNPLRRLARTEAVGRVLTRPGRRRARNDGCDTMLPAAGPIRYLIVGFTDSAWTSRHWPAPFPWRDLTRPPYPPGYSGGAPFVVVRRLDGGAPATEPVGFAKSVHAAYFERFQAPRWELEPAPREGRWDVIRVNGEPVAALIVAKGGIEVPPTGHARQEMTAEGVARHVDRLEESAARFRDPTGTARARHARAHEEQDGLPDPERPILDPRQEATP